MDCRQQYSHTVLLLEKPGGEWTLTLGSHRLVYTDCAAAMDAYNQLRDIAFAEFQRISDEQVVGGNGKDGNAA